MSHAAYELVLRDVDPELIATLMAAADQIAVDPEQAFADQLVCVAVSLRPAVLAASGHSFWPECPRHPGMHDLVAQVNSGRAVWLCPRSGREWARVGHLRG